MKKVNLQKLSLQIASSSGEGMQVEACKADSNGNSIAGESSPIITFLSEKEDEILVEIYNGKELLKFPLKELEKAIFTAKKEVHSEEFYD